MSQGLGFKIGLFSAMAGAACAAAMGVAAYCGAQSALTGGLRKQARGAASLVALKTSDQLQSLVDRSRFYVSSSQPMAFARDGALLGLSLLQKPPSADEETDWKASRRWLLSKDSPGRID